MHREYVVIQVCKVEEIEITKEHQYNSNWVPKTNLLLWGDQGRSDLKKRIQTKCNLQDYSVSKIIVAIN